MNPLEPRAIIEAASRSATVFYRFRNDVPAMHCYLLGAIETLKRIMGDQEPEVSTERYDHEARLTELVNQYHAFTRAAEDLARQLGPTPAEQETVKRCIAIVEQYGGLDGTYVAACQLRRYFRLNKDGTPTTEVQPSTKSVTESDSLNPQHPPLPRTVP